MEFSNLSDIFRWPKIHFNQNDTEEISAAQVFHDTIKEKARIGQVTGDLILSFEKVLVLTPRGRYGHVPRFFEIARDYKVLYQSIARALLVTLTQG
jgi:structure-specific recognition protein 1